MTDKKFLLLKMHSCVAGLSDEAVQEIADAAELLHFNSGDVVHQSHEVVTSINLVIHGRLKLNLIDLHGDVSMRMYEHAGGQYGGLSAALAGSAPIECIAEDPTTILRLDFQTGLELSKKHEIFRLNMLRNMAESVRQTLLKNKDPVRPRLVAIYHQSPETRDLSRKLIIRLNELGESTCVLTDCQNWVPIRGVPDRKLYTNRGVEIDLDEVRRQIHAWSDSQRIFIDVETPDVTGDTATLNACDLVLWCVTPKFWQESVSKLETLLSQAPTWKDKICIVWMMDQEPVGPLANELSRLARRTIKVSFAEPGPNQGRAMFNGFERLVHLLRGVQIGVALGGGGARGMAHLGVLKALEDHGIIVDMIAGTSAGAMTGTLYASDMKVDYSIDRFENDLRPPWLFRHLPGGDQWSLLYRYRRGQFDPMLRKYLHNYQIEQLPVPMNSITADLISGKVMVRDQGDAVDGIIESINLPLLALPVMRNGQALVDGGVINNVPADVLVAKGCNFVIAVNVSAKMKLEFSGNRADTQSHKTKPPSTLQTLVRTYVVQSATANSAGAESADVVIEPDLTKYKLTDFVRTAELAKVGEETTRDAIPKIKELLAKLDGRLFANQSV